MRVITEPTAAALALPTPPGRRTFVVVHMGGGACDVAVLDVGEGVIMVQALSGDPAFGGQEFDQVLIDWFTDEFRSRQPADLRLDAAARWRLREAAEQAKKDLSQRTEVRVEVPYLMQGANGPLDFGLVVSRDEFERRTAPLIERCRALILRCLEDARLKPGAVDEVLLVGGMMRMPALRQVVREIFDRDPSAVHSEEAVARGAAIQGAQLQLGSRAELLLVDVAPVTFGVETEGGAFVEILPRNKTIPVEKVEVFTTAAADQPGVSLRIFQSESPEASRYQFLAQLDLDGLPSANAGELRIEVRFTMDHNGVLWVTASEEGSGRAKTIRVARGRRLTLAEANDLRRKAENNAAEREKHEPLAAARRRALACLDRLAALLRRYPDLDAVGVAHIQAQADQVRERMRADDVAALQGAVDGLVSSLEALDGWLKGRPNQAHPHGELEL
jgi:molecular chaperone DnaK